MKLTTILENTEAAFLEIAVRAVSILSPVPTAYLVYDRTIKYLQWPDTIASIAAAVVEGFGFSSIHIFLTLIQYNQTKRQKDPTAPTWIAVALIAFYILSVISLTIMLDTFPELARFATILFPAFSLCGAGLLVLRYNHANRLQAIASQKAQEREERKQRKEIPVAQAPVPITKRGTFEDFLIASAARNGKGPMKAGEVMAAFNVPKRTAYNWIAKQKETP